LFPAIPPEEPLIFGPYRQIAIAIHVVQLVERQVLATGSDFTNALLDCPDDSGSIFTHDLLLVFRRPEPHHALGSVTLPIKAFSAVDGRDCACGVVVLAFEAPSKSRGHLRNDLCQVVMQFLVVGVLYNEYARTTRFKYPVYLSEGVVKPIK